MGGFLLLIPFVGFALNMGCRLRMVSRMQRGLSPWPCWREPLILWKKGLLATAAILGYHLPALAALALALLLRRLDFLLLGLALGMAATFLLPGFLFALNRLESFFRVQTTNAYVTLGPSGGSCGLL